MFSCRLEQKSREVNMAVSTQDPSTSAPCLLLVEANVGVASVVANSRRSADLESMSGGGCPWSLYCSVSMFAFSNNRRVSFSIGRTV